MMQTPVASRSMGRLNSAAEKEKDTNIQVVVRCRDAPMRQLKNNATIVVHPVHGQDVKIDGPASVARAYHYDGVFGPRATQEHIYDKVVRPILHEVMQGYNCTIFAYGQTGTGKTYTMEGDLDGAGPARPSLGPLGSPEPATPLPARMTAAAGVIPRTLYNLFYALDKQSAEYYVRVSYVELYNEELHDLLGRDDAAGEMAPPGSHLRVFESGKDKGVVIQGLEERLVTSARDAVAALQAGAARRRVAATRCNDASSRSHAIFTVTVFIRERAVTAEGEDIVKLGKLNLVDLAGSENIGRSGAQDARAREAGNINRSLLTLGRVINALVDRNSYVPYRDSKLTYILKDSLGGRTRTCMIATISNAADNIEETLKTLQYASQAKGIRNRPVANKKVSKSEIVHDMQHQIEQLRRDLDAARDGTGFFITRESHAELVEDKNRYSAAIDEWRRRIAEADEQQAALAGRAQRLAAQLAEQAAALAHTQARLAAEQAAHAQAQARLAGQQLLTRAHAHHERQMLGVAQGLHGARALAAADASQLHARLARVAQQEAAHVRVAQAAARRAGADAERAAAAARAQAGRAADGVRALAAGLRQRLGGAFDQAVRGRLGALREALHVRAAEAGAQARADAEGARAPADAALAALMGLVRGVEEDARGAQGACDRACDEFARALDAHGEQQRARQMEHLAHVRQTLEAHVGRLATLQAALGERRARESAELALAAQQLGLRHAEEIAALERQVEEMAGADEEDARRLVEHVAQALADSRARRGRAAGALLGGARAVAQQAADAQRHAVAGFEAAAEDAGAVLGEGAGAARLAFDEATQAAMRLVDASAEGAAELAAGLQAHHAAVRAAAEGAALAAGQAHEGAREHVEEARGRVGRMAELVHEAVESMGAAGAQAAEAAVDAGGCALDEVAGAVAEADERAGALGEELSGLAEKAAEEVVQIAVHVQRSAEGITPTPDDGTVPAPRAYEAAECWQVTRDHAYILEHAGTQSAEQLAWTG
ncbi:Kinesin- motor protein, partial [Coemansia erecta]